MKDNVGWLGKYFVCDEYQSELLDLVEDNLHKYSSFYRNIKKTVYGDNLIPKLQERGFLMVVRDNNKFRQIVKKFDSKQSIILYSMWDGYRTQKDSSFPDFLGLVENWAPIHTSGHATKEDIYKVIRISKPDIIIPIHIDSQKLMKEIYQNENIVIANDGEEILI